MLILAIECSGIAGSVALFRDEQELAYRELPANQSSVMSLAACVREILADCAALANLSIVKPGLVCVTNGPGSFTGLRVGLATAKMLAFAWNIPVVAVDSLAAISLRASKMHASKMLANKLDPPDGDSQPLLLVAVMNAYRKQVFVSVARAEPFSTLMPAQVVDASAWSEKPLKSLVWDSPNGCPEDAHVIFTGPALSLYTPQLNPNLRIEVDSVWNPRAIEVANLGWQGFQNGETVSAAQLQPNYVRGSAAEENANPAPR